MLSHLESPRAADRRVEDAVAVVRRVGPAARRHRRPQHRHGRRLAHRLDRRAARGAKPGHELVLVRMEVPVFDNFSEHADGERRGLVWIPECSHRKGLRVFRCLHIGAGPRRSPSACPEDNNETAWTYPTNTPTAGAAPPPSASGTHSSHSVPLIVSGACGSSSVRASRAGGAPTYLRSAETTRPERVSIFFSVTFRRMPTANAEGQIESEGSVGKVSGATRRHESSAFAVGMRRDVGKKKALGRLVA